MKVLFQKLDIVHSELQKTRVEVAAWESPVLQAVHGENVLFVSESYIDRKEVPEAGDEFVRLANRYKPDVEESTPPVAAVYGNFGPGIASLQKAIQAATQDEGVRRVSAEETAAIDASASQGFVGEDSQIAGLV